MANRKYSNAYAGKALPVTVVDAKTGKKKVGATAVMDMNNRVSTAVAKGKVPDREYDKDTNRTIRQTNKITKGRN